MMLRGRDVIEMPVTYCRDNAKVQAFVADRVRDFNPYRVPESARDVLNAAISEFGHSNCFYLEIQPH